MAKRESYRNVRKERYTQVSNSLLNDKEATLQAKGLLSIFLSNSDDWETNMAEIITRSKNGRDAHYRVVNELIKLGYFARIQVTGHSKNRFEEMIYIFSDIKQDVADELENIKKWAETNDKDLIIEYKTKKEKKIKIEPFAPFTENQEAENKYTETKDINNTKKKNIKENNTKLKDIVNKENESNKNNDQVNTKQEIVDKLILEYMKKGLNKKVSYMVIDQIMPNGEIPEGVTNLGGYIRNALENTLHRSQVKHGIKDSAEKLKNNSNISFYNWLED